MSKTPQVSTEVPTTTVNSDLFGSATTNQGGTSFKSTDFQKNLTGINENAAINAANEYFNPNYDSDEFKAGDAYYTNKLNNTLQNDYLNGALSNGLLRGSTASDIMRGFGTDLANTEYERQRQYKQDQADKLSTALSGYNSIYNIANGLMGLSNSTNNQIASYQQSGEKANQQAALTQQQMLANTLSSALGNNPIGSAIGGGITSLGSSLAKSVTNLIH